MTNVLAPYSESLSIYNGYQKMGLLDTPLAFIIPIYNNMKEIPTDNPNINMSNYVQDKTKVLCNATNVNIRTGPGTSYETITKVSNPETMTRILKSTSSGERWDKVQLENGIVGYIFQQYVTEKPKPQIENISIQIDNKILQKGDKKQLKITISPSEASSNKVIFSSSNPNVLTVDDKGNLRAIRSGTATITVKSAENSVQSQINLTVYSAVTKITIDYSKLNMSEYDTFKINAYIEPEDANIKEIIYQSLDNNIASIDNTGKITAIAQGKTSIYAISKENPNIKAECEIYITKKISQTELQFESPLVTNSLEITGISYPKNTVKYIKDKIKTNLDLEFIDRDGNILTDTKQVGTGSKILIKQNGNIISQYTIIIYGDVNGDGKINSIDLLVLQRHILGIDVISGPFLKSANVSKNNKKPTSIDLLLIQRHILGLQLIKQ